MKPNASMKQYYSDICNGQYGYEEKPEYIDSNQKNQLDAYEQSLKAMRRSGSTNDLKK